MKENALIFGAGGALGSMIYKRLSDDGFTIYTAGSGKGIASDKHIKINYQAKLEENVLNDLPLLNSVVWAHGLNINDSIISFESSKLDNLLRSNVTLIASTMASLFSLGKLAQGCRLCVVSSILQLESRHGKLSYSISKSALQGLVKSCALDLGSHGILVNAVLPGIIDTPMTRNNLDSQHIARLSKQSALNKLAQPEDIASAVSFLVSQNNKAITGQFLIVDCGFIGLNSFTI